MYRKIQGAQPKVLALEAYAGRIGEVVDLHGTVHKVRRMSGFAFLVLRTGRALLQCVYDPQSAAFDLDGVPEGASVQVRGEIAEDARSKLGWELRLTDCQVLSRPAGELPVVINGKALSATLETLLDHRAVTLRNPKERAIFRIQAGLCEGIRSFLVQADFVEIHTPKLGASGAEGGANMFRLEYFGQTAYLAQSPQLYKQMMVGVFEQVFEIAPVFRAEKHDTARHLNEYTSVDLEMGFLNSFRDIMAVETAMLTHMMDHLQQHFGPEIDLLEIKIPEVGEIPALAFDEAKTLVAETYGYASEDAKDLDPEEERLLCRWCREATGSEFLFITHYPTEKRPFYAMETPGQPQVTESFDLLFRGLEITTGGQRIHDYHEQLAKMARLGMDPGPFAGYLAAHHGGLPPHGGLGLGLERLTAQLLGLGNLRRATLFPRDCVRLVP